MSGEVTLRSLAIFLTLLMLALFTNSDLACAENKPTLQTIPWQDYSSAAFDQAKTNKRLVLLYGKSKTCHWCQEMDKITWQTPAVIQALQNNFIPILVDVDAQIAIAARYRITSLPTMIILDSDNRIIKVLSGYLPPEAMLKELNSPTQNVIVKVEEPTMAMTGLSAPLREQLQKKNVAENFNENTIEYALLTAAQNEKLAHAQIATALNSQQPLLDLEKKPALQAEALRLYAELYAYWHDPAYLAMAEKLKNDMHVGVPPIFARESGLMITALTYYYMIKGDPSVLAEALKAARWDIDNLSIPGGGFRHVKNENNNVYLNDTLAVGNAFLTLYKATSDPEYLNRAVDAAQFINKYFQNPKGDGFVTSLVLTSSTDSLVFSAEENADIVRFTAVLWSYTGDKFLQQMQASAFHYLIKPDVIVNTAPALILTADYFVTNHPIHIAIVGSKNDTDAKNLYATALANSPLNLRIDWWDKKEGPMLNSDAVYPAMDKSAAYVCHGFQCSFPIFKAQDLLAILHDIIAPPQALSDTKIIPVQFSHSINNPMSAENLLTGKNWILIILGFIGFGVLLSFTPCILPLVPIMASIIVGQTIGVKKEKTFLLCLSYVFSMSLTYSMLGLLAGAFGIYLQLYMQATWIVVLFSLLFFLLALSMLGAYELKLPSVLQQKFNKWNNLPTGGTYIGVMGMGVLSTLIISPCVTAPLAGVLSFIMKTSDYLLGAVGLFCMGLGMGSPLLIISLFSRNILPKAARWNNQIKSFFGVILLGVSIWIVSRVLSDAFSMMLWSAFIIFTTVYMGITKRKTKNLFDKFWKTLTIMIFVYGIALFCNALFMNSDLYHRLSLNQKALADNSAASAVFKNIKNKADLESALHNAQANHLPILLDFSAQWCSSCINLERNVFTDANIQALMQKFMLLRVDLTHIDNDSMILARQFNVIAPPIILFFDEQGQLKDNRVTGDLNVAQFKQILDNVISTSLKK